MRAFHPLLAFLLIVNAAGFSQSASSAKPGSGFSIDNIDKSVDPCVDFYQYACGNWIKNSEIPADRPSWQSFSELDESNLQIERGILEKAAAGGAGRNAIDQKIGDLYGSCMDEKAVDAKGIAPIKPELDRIAAVKDKGALIDEIGHLHLVGANVRCSTSIPHSDLHNADQVIAYIGSGRAVAAGPRLLHQRRCRQSRDAQASGGVCDAGVYAGGADSATGGRVPRRPC